MRKLFVLIPFLCALVFAAAPTNDVVDGYYEIAEDTTISNSTAFDTLSGVDSVTLFTRALGGYNSGGEYILSRDAITGGGTDSLYLQVVVDVMDGSGNVFRRAVIDSFTAAAGEDVLIPIGGTLFGTKYRMKLIGYGDNGGEVIINRLKLLYRRVVSKCLPIGR